MADVESPSAGQPLCVWAQASRNFAIHIPQEVIGNLGTESLVAFKRVPRRGLETGGILLGRTESRDDTTTFFIEGFVPVESEHRFGPSYVLSDADFAHLQTELTRNGNASIGIYRSQTRSDQLAIQDADVGLFEKCFGVSDSLFLMLAPVPRIAAFYFREDGDLKCVHQFTVVSNLSSVATQSRTSPPPVNPPSPPSAGTHRVHANITRHAADQADALVISSQRADQKELGEAVATADRGTGSAASESPAAHWSSGRCGSWMTAIRRRAAELRSDCIRRSSAVKLRSWVLAGVTLAVLTVNLLSYSLRRSVVPDHQAPSYLYLTVERAGPGLRLLWNSSAVRGATRAVLHIQDGDQQSDRELAPSELMAGQFTYQPRHPAVTFRLNAYAGQPNATGLIQVMFPPSPVTAVPSLEPIAPPVENRPSAQPPSSLTARTGALIARAEAAPAAGRQFSRVVPSDDKKEQNVPAQLPVVRQSSASKSSPLALREPPLRTGFEASRPLSFNSEKNAISTSDPELTVRASTTPVPSSRLGRLFGKIPFVGRSRKQAKAVEAVPAYQAQPIIRMPNHLQLVRPVAVGVKVYIGESGAVDDAEVVDYGDPLNLTLANAALAAARNWKFAPSRVDDIPVASQAIIHFYFSP